MKVIDETTDEEMKRGIIYCRVSSKEQVEGTSLDSQERLCREYAERQDIEILKMYVEEGESAKTADRAEFKKALAFCANKKNNVNYFIVHKLDRFSRKQENHLTIRSILHLGGVELRSVTEPIDETPVGKVMEGVLTAFAEFDNNVRSERSQGGMLERVKEGIWCWPEPLGYYRPTQGANIAPQPEIAPLILLGFEEYSKGTHTYKSLATFLGDRGVKTKKGKIPCPQLMEKMIKNPIYWGFMNVWGGYMGTFEPIVSKELFDKCQEGFKNSSHSAPRSKSNPLFPLCGAVCSVCHGSISGSSSTGRRGKKYPYYHHHSGAHCSHTASIPKESFEQSFVELLGSITPDKKYEKLFKAVVIDIWQSNYKKLDGDNSRVRKEIEKLEQDRQRVFDLHRAHKYTDEEFEEQKRIANESIYQKKRLLQEKAVEEFDMEEALDYCFNFVRATSKTWLEANDQNKRRFQGLVFKGKLEFDGEKFGTPKLSALYKLNREYSGKKSSLVALQGVEPWLQE